MANMSYCRFENTANDLQDCIYAIEDGDVSALSSFEIRGAERIINQIKSNQIKSDEKEYYLQNGH